MLKTAAMDAASVVDVTRLSACAPVLREIMQLGVVEDAGHMVLMERPEATVRAICDFLEAA